MPKKYSITMKGFDRKKIDELVYFLEHLYNQSAMQVVKNVNSL